MFSHQVFQEDGGEASAAANEEHHHFPAINSAEDQSYFDLLLRQNNYCFDEKLVSGYIYNTPGKLSWSEAPDEYGLNVLWRSDDEVGTNSSLSSSSGTSQTLLYSPSNFKQKIRKALLRSRDFYDGPTLVQCWGLTTGVGGEHLLSTSHLPFGLKEIERGLCGYRKKCVEVEYIVIPDDDDGVGYRNNEYPLGPPPLRVFCRGVPEIRGCVETYTIQDYPLRDFAMVECGVKNYMALPLYEYHRGQQRCVGVLEILSSDSPLDYCSSVTRALKDVTRFQTSNIFLLNDLPFYAEQCLKIDGTELEKRLKMVCEAHNLPFAQIWMKAGVDSYDDEVLICPINISYMENKKYCSYLDACQKGYLKSGEGVVGKAYEYYRSAWYCKDVTQLTQHEYSLAVDATQPNLCTCFAIALLSVRTWEKFILEIFLPDVNTTPIQLLTFLGSLLGTISHHFKSFQLGYFLIRGEELDVKVIRLSEDDELDDFKIFGNSNSVPTVCSSQNEQQNLQLGVHFITIDGDGGETSAAAANEEHHHFPAINSAEDQSYFGQKLVSGYIYNTPGKLSWLKAMYDGELNVFWRSSDDEVVTNSSLSSSSSSGTTQTLYSPPNFKQKIRKALLRLSFTYTGPTLVQWWGLSTSGVGGEHLLSTSHLPFGLKEIERGLCGYRKKCVEVEYIVIPDDDDGVGYRNNEYPLGPPPLRVFCSGVPEMRGCVESYTTQEYPLRDFAMECGLKTYMALPLYEYHRDQQRCVGVLEILSSSASPSHFLLPDYHWDSVAGALKLAGLRTSNILLLNDLSFYAEQCLKSNDIELEKRLKMVCKAHNLPFAQIWMRGGLDSYEDELLICPINISYMENNKYCSYLDACQKGYLKSGEGVVGKAYEDEESAWYCKDVTQLTQHKYSLALDATHPNLRTCFAIALWSSFSMKMFILEIFLPDVNTTCKQLSTFLGSLLATIRHHFNCFLLYNGLKKGEKLSVKVIRSSEDDEFDDFAICEAPYSIPAQCSSQNEQQNLQLGVHFTTFGGGGVCPDRISVSSANTNETEISSNVQGEMQLNPPHQSLSLPPTNAVDEVTTETSNQGHKITEELAQTFNQSRCKGRKITKEDLEQLNGRMNIDEAARTFDVSRSTIKRRCRELDINWTYIRTKQPNNSKTHVADDDCVEDEPQSISDGSLMNIKAKYKGDMIKFDLSLSSTLVELMGEITKRYNNLKIGTFKVKYQDEDGDWILLACDEDLHKCIGSMRSLGKAVVNIRVMREKK